MFTNLLPKDDIPFSVGYSHYASRHFLKQFQKDNPGKQWAYTDESVQKDLSSISYEAQDIQQTQQVNELWHKDEYWIFKYEFRVAGKKESAKDAGNRCVIFLDNGKKTAEILMIFHHKYLPKNTHEQQFIESTIMAEFPDYITKCR
jgi:hypothetical protein